MINNNKHKSGYKHTSLGWIPEEWEVKNIIDVADYVDYRGATPKKTNNGRFLITARNIKDGWIDYEISKEYVAEIEYENIMRRGKPQIGDVLITTEAPLGSVAQIDREDIALAQRVIKYSAKNNELNNSYLKHYFLSPNFQRILDDKSTGSTAKGIKGSVLHKLPIPIPIFLEQQKIATILSTWDKAIDVCKQTIEKLEQRNKGLMQQLLTGKKRLKGFTEPWKEVHLAEVFTERNETGHINLPLLSVGSLGIYPQSDSIKKDTSNEDKSKYKRICPDDIGYNTMRMWQGRSALSNLEGIVSPAYTIVSPKSCAYSPFYAFLFKLPSVVNKFFRNSQGLVEDTLNCKFKDFAVVKVYVPQSVGEQLAIAELLIKVSSEIRLYETMLISLQQQKKGLMQKLLTGEVRVKI